MGLIAEYHAALSRGEANKAEKIIGQIIGEKKVGARKTSANEIDDLLSELFKSRLKKNDKDGALRVIAMTGDPISVAARKEKLQKKLG